MSLRRREYLDELKGEADFYKFLHKRNRGVFYRGSDKGGKGIGMGAIGAGVYLTWDKRVAKAFAQHHGQGGKVEAYKLKPGLKILDSRSQLVIDLKAEMGFDPYGYTDDPMFANFITYHAKKAGFDGVISDKLAEGLVIFDFKKMKKVKE